MSAPARDQGVTIRAESQEGPTTFDSWAGVRWRVWVNDALIIDELEGGTIRFDDRAHAIRTALFMAETLAGMGRGPLAPGDP